MGSSHQAKSGSLEGSSLSAHHQLLLARLPDDDNWTACIIDYSAIRFCREPATGALVELGRGAFSIVSRHACPAGYLLYSKAHSAAGWHHHFFGVVWPTIFMFQVQITRAFRAQVYKVLLDGVLPYAAKVLHLGDNPKAEEMFLKEAALLRRLRHRNIVGERGGVGGTRRDGWVAPSPQG